MRGHDHFPVYVDSPLANEATGVFLQCDPVCFDAETTALIEKGINPIYFDDLKVSVTSDDSKAINFDPAPKVIISASGMCEAGRIRHHLKHNLWRPESLVLFVGYQAAGTLGRAILTTEPKRSSSLERKSPSKPKSDICRASAATPTSRDSSTGWADLKQNRLSCLSITGRMRSAKPLPSAFGRNTAITPPPPYSGTSYDLLTGQSVSVTDGVRIPKARPAADSRAGAPCLPSSWLRHSALSRWQNAVKACPIRISPS